jgi:hypothetical protein
MWSRMTSAGVRRCADTSAARLQPGHLLSESKLALLNQAVVASCRGKSNNLPGDAFISDTLVAPRQTLDFYDRLQKSSGAPGRVQDFARLFMAPGVMHCGGGPGPAAFDAAIGEPFRPPSDSPREDLFAAMAHWVEDGVAPAQVIATKYVDDAPAKGIALQRPLCAYPRKAWYKGSGDTSDAASFTCELEPPQGQ